MLITWFPLPIFPTSTAARYDPVQAIGEVLEDINKKNNWQIGIHVDAASGGFVAPFQPGCAPWDFRVPTVLSISASGHKFGESVCGTVCAKGRKVVVFSCRVSSLRCCARFGALLNTIVCLLPVQGWVVWRDRKDLSEYVAVDVAYLGGKAESFTLNFSRPASGLYVQLYKFLRLGRDGTISAPCSFLVTLAG